MINLSTAASITQKFLRDNSPTILTGLGVSGAIGTAYLTGRASWQAAGRIARFDNGNMTLQDKVVNVWDLYIPAAITGIVTVGCIIGANQVSSKRTAAAYSILALTEKGFSEYREKVVEQIGEKKEQKVRDGIAQDHIQKNPPGQVIAIGSGPVLCCELLTGRYFNSDMETLRRAQNDVNNKLIGDMYATLSYFYHLIGLAETSHSGNIGWEAGKPMALEFTAVMSEDSRPCMAFDYNYTKPL